MSVDLIVGRLADVQQKLFEAPLTRSLSETLRNIFIDATKAEISLSDRSSIINRWTYDYKIEGLNRVFQILLPYCTAQTIAWHYGADRWLDKNEEVSVQKKHCIRKEPLITDIKNSSKTTLRISIPKKDRAQTLQLEDISNVRQESLVPVSKETRPKMKPMNVYVQYPPNIIVRRLERIDLNVVKKTAEILRTDGFKKEEERDLNYELVQNLSVAETQGSSSFCNKVVEHTTQTPHALSPSYLRVTEQVNRELSLELRYKRFGHAFSMKGMVPLPSGKYACLEGANESFVFAMLRDTFEKFAFTRKDLVFCEMYHSINASLSQALWHDNATDKKIEEIHKLIHDQNYPHPVVVSSGNVWHSTQGIFFSDGDDDYMGYCNRGEDCGKSPGISIYKIQHKNKITPEFLKRIAARLSVDNKGYTSLKKLIVELGGVNYIYIPMKYQKIGNCVYVSAKAGIYILLIIAFSKKVAGSLSFSEAVTKNARLIYKEFSKLDKELILEDILIDIEKAPRDDLMRKESSYYEGLSAVAALIKSWALAHLGRDKIDEDLLEKALRLT